MKLRTITATRYVTPLREGGSLPAIVEADDDGLYVLKFRGAGQGPKALIAELVAGEIARALQLPVPEIVFINLNSELARTEPDPEIQDLIRASAGLNLALDYLPGSITFDPVADKPDASLAASCVWLDSYVANVDRTPRNANILVWHKRLWLIDHGSALYFHHSWNNFSERSCEPFPMIKDHILLKYSNSLEEIDIRMSRLISPGIITEIVNLIPDEWLSIEIFPDGMEKSRSVYIEFLQNRLEQPHYFIEEAIRARSLYI